MSILLKARALLIARALLRMGVGMMCRRPIGLLRRLVLVSAH